MRRMLYEPPIGSDFAWPPPSALVRGRAELPWMKAGRPVRYFESGRQAITAVSRYLRSAGRTTLFMPGYYCQSMIEPFVRDGWQINFVPVSTNLEISSDFEVDEPGVSVVFSIPYFGVSENADWLARLSAAQRQGALVLSDETHRVLGSGLYWADYAIASLRKMLPVPDGAYLIGAIPPADMLPSSVAALRVDAMRAKAQNHPGDTESTSGVRAAFVLAEKLTAKRPDPAYISRTTLSLLPHFKYQAFTAARDLNARTLTEMLREGPYAEVQRTGDVRSHYVISGPDVHALQRYLASRSVFCPIHWSVPETDFRPGRPWPVNLLSLPIDHRYSTSEMERISTLVNEFGTGSIGQ